MVKQLNIKALYTNNNNNNIRLIESSQNARQHKTRPTSATQDNYT